jgi:3-deoxy-D-manno-octulosonic-acid transferase
MPRTTLVYRTGLLLARGLVPAAGIFAPKIKLGHLGRTSALDRLRSWGESSRDPNRPLVWLHAPSVGEGLQARAVLLELRARHPDWQYAFTFFSPSAEALASSLPVDVSAYLPYDTPSDVGVALGVLRPDALVFTKLDLWPELACRARAAGCKVMLVAGTVRPGSSRLNWPARALLAPGYKALTAVGAVAREDALRLSAIGVSPERISVTGDPRYDSVMERVHQTPPDDPLLGMAAGGPLLVAGSTWPDDEAVLLAAFKRIHEEFPDARLIVAPHEPSQEHLAGVELAAGKLGLPHPVRLSVAHDPAPLLIVDRLGALASIYGAGQMAFVGGSMGSIGIHSVIEPAAWGIPVLFGPSWNYSRDAGELLEAGAATALGDKNPVDDLVAVWRSWLMDDETRRAMGERALRVVQDGVGAAERSADLIDRVLVDDSSFDGDGAG